MSVVRRRSALAALLVLLPAAACLPYTVGTSAQTVPANESTQSASSYFAPNGRYSADDRFFSSHAYTAAPLSAPRALTAGGNGVFRPGSGFPVEASPVDANYYVDVQFVDGSSQPPSVLTIAPEGGQIDLENIC